MAFGWDAACIALASLVFLVADILLGMVVGVVNEMPFTWRCCHDMWVCAVGLYKERLEE